MPPRRRRQPRQERRLARPEAGVSQPGDRGGEKGLPRLLNEREAAEPDRQEHERDRQRRAPADPVDHDPDRRAGQEADRSDRREDEPRRAQRDPADVVEVDDEEREREPVADRVRQAAQVEDPDRPGQPRVEAPEVAPETGSTLSERRPDLQLGADAGDDLVRELGRASRGRRGRRCGRPRRPPRARPRGSPARPCAPPRRRCARGAPRRRGSSPSGSPRPCP